MVMAGGKKVNGKKDIVAIVSRNPLNILSLNYSATPFPTSVFQLLANVLPLHYAAHFSASEDYLQHLILLSKQVKC